MVELKTAAEIDAMAAAGAVVSRGTASDRRTCEPMQPQMLFLLIALHKATYLLDKERSI